MSTHKPTTPVGEGYCPALIIPLRPYSFANNGGCTEMLGFGANGVRWGIVGPSGWPKKLEECMGYFTALPVFAGHTFFPVPRILHTTMCLCVTVWILLYTV